ncbi:unnamed protein product [marine sediment metagenome]|uniref:Uncharacterized protein n=1 Tax=marine sediment metagenome TaxID=412755 RepID=X1LPT7_9ZZZZ
MSLSTLLQAFVQAGTVYYVSLRIFSLKSDRFTTWSKELGRVCLSENGSIEVKGTKAFDTDDARAADVFAHTFFLLQGDYSIAKLS